MDETTIIGSASSGKIDNITGVVTPKSKNEGEFERSNWLRRNKFRILLGVIGILIYSLLSISSDLDKSNTQLKQTKETLNWLAHHNRDVREERDFYSKLSEDLNYYKFVKMVYAAKDKDFFETITIAYEESKKQNTNPWKTMSIMYIESGFKQYAQSPVAYGLMQIHYNYWKDAKNLTMENIFDKRTNIRVGLEIYNEYLRLANGNEFLALFYYNNGPAMPTEKQNHDYAPAVLESKFMKLSVNYNPIILQATLKQ